MSTEYTRRIYINGNNVSDLIDTCSFSWKSKVGCDTASLSAKSVINLEAFGETSSTFAVDAVVQIYLNDESCWFIGIITEISGSLTGGLSMSASGYANTILKELFAFGRYGNAVELQAVETNGTPYLGYVKTDGAGKLGNGSHAYSVTPFDSVGERIAGYQHTLHVEDDRITGAGISNLPFTLGADDLTCPSNHVRRVDVDAEDASVLSLYWDNDTMVTKWRVYKYFNEEMVTAPIGAGNTSGLHWEYAYYVDVTVPEFTDDGTFDWVNEADGHITREVGGELQTMWDTCRIPFNYGNYSVQDTVRYLVQQVLADTDYAAVYNESKITLSGVLNVDDFDFELDENTPLLDAIKTLAEYAGDIEYGVDADGDFYFIDSPSESSETAVTIKQYADTDTTPDAERMSIQNITRTLTRDGISTVDVSLPDEVEAALVAEGYDAEVSENAKDGMVVVIHGARTRDAVETIVQNVLGNYRDTFGKWQVNLKNCLVLLKPEDLVEVVYADNGYVMKVQEVGYTFGDTVETNLTCGEPDIYDIVMQEREKALTNTVKKSAYSVAASGEGNPETMRARQLPKQNLTIVPKTGTSRIPAPLDHSHGYSPRPFNALHELAGMHPTTSYFRMAQVVALDADGDRIEVYLWDNDTQAWETETTLVYKPQYLRASYWEGQTLTYTDGTAYSYNATGLDKTYQRQATWDGGVETELQEITPPYGVGEEIMVTRDASGKLVDWNQASRQFAYLGED